MVHYLCVLLEPGTIKQRSQKVTVGSEVHDGLFMWNPVSVAFLTFHLGILSASEDGDLRTRVRFFSEFKKKKSHALHMGSYVVHAWLCYLLFFGISVLKSQKNTCPVKTHDNVTSVWYFTRRVTINKWYEQIVCVCVNKFQMFKKCHGRGGVKGK